VSPATHLKGTDAAIPQVRALVRPPSSPIKPQISRPSQNGLFLRAVSPVLFSSSIERFLLRPLYGRDDVLQLLITFAAFMIMDNLQRLIWGVQPIFANEPLKLLPNISVFGVNYTSYQVLLLPCVALLTLIGLRYFLRRTPAGAVIMAVTEPLPGAHDRRGEAPCPAPRTSSVRLGRTRSFISFSRNRPCVRCVLCWRALPLAPALGSTGSAAVGTALFVGFTAKT
jgi:hypothetical protein